MENPSQVEEVGAEGEMASTRARGHEAAATTVGMSRAATMSSHKDNRDSAKACHMLVVPQHPQSASWQVTEMTADTVNPNVTSTGSTRPEGMSYNPPDQLPSTSLKGGRAEPSNELSEVPMDKMTSTTQPMWKEQDDRSSGEVHEVAKSHEEAVGEDIEGSQVKQGHDADTQSNTGDIKGHREVQGKVQGGGCMTVDEVTMTAQ